MFGVQSLKSISQYKSNASGQVGVMFALMALPLLALTTFALDYTKYTHVEDNVVSALDGASLAAILNQTVTESQRADIARKFFWENFHDDDNFKLEVMKSSQEMVELKVIGYVDLSVSDALGMKKFKIEKMSASKTT